MRATLFAYQVFLPLADARGAFNDDAPLRSRLHKAITAGPVRATAAEKRVFYQGLIDLVMPAVPSFVRGNWDYTDESREAETEYARWCRGTVGDARERPTVAAAPGESRYFFLTLLFLMTRGQPDDLRLEKATQLRPAELWRRSTFAALLGTLRSLTLEGMRSDAVYLCPGADDHGLTEAELAADRYAYLHPIV